MLKKVGSFVSFSDFMITAEADLVKVLNVYGRRFQKYIG